jgi:hypothetical protein
MEDGGHEESLRLHANKPLQRQGPLLDDGLVVRRPVFRIGNRKQIAPGRLHHHPRHGEAGSQPDEAVGPRERLDGHRRDIEVA